MTIPPTELAHLTLDVAPAAMMLIDDAAVVRFANRQVVALFGYPLEKVIGKGVGQFIPSCSRGGCTGHGELSLVELRSRLMGAQGSLTGRREDGTEFPVEMSLGASGDAEGSYVVVMRNVSDQRRVEASLMAAREESDRANLGKSRFLATASHDLRQPVQTLALLNGILRRTVSDPAAAEALSQQEQAIGAVSHLLNALLDISKLESGTVKPEQTDFAVTSVFNGLRRDFARLAESKGLTLDAEGCVECVHSDRSLVEQILRNIVANAIKYTREGCVRLRCLREQAMVRIEVLDTGVGIPADQLGFIYDEFYQVGAPSNSSRDGFGLGLSIVQRLVKLLNLRLDVRSEVGKGSAFSLQLPLGVSQAGSLSVDGERCPVSQPRTDGPHVLLVEDDDAVREATRMLLKVEGYCVSAVSSSEEALQSVRDEARLDLLVTDYHLNEGAKGTDVMAALRKSLGASLKTVLITGDTSSAVKELPRDPYLRVTSKPVKAEELLALLRELLAT